MNTRFVLLPIIGVTFSLLVSSCSLKAENSKTACGPSKCDSPCQQKTTDTWAYLPETVASYGENKITKDQFVGFIKQQMKMTGRPVDQLDGRMFKQVAPRIAAELIDRQILLGLAEKDGIKADAKLVRDDMQKGYEAMPEAQREKLEAQLKLQGKTLAQLETEVCGSKAAQENAAIDKWILDYVSKGIKVGDQQVTDFYHKNEARFHTPENVTAAHILIKPESDKPAAKKAAAQKAAGILAKIKAGEDFGALAKAESACSSGKQANGKLGTFRRGQMVKAFEDAAFALKPGETSGVVETQYGYHIIKVEDHKQSQRVPLTKVKDLIRQQLRGMELERRIKEKLATEREKLQVKVNV